MKQQRIIGTNFKKYIIQVFINKSLAIQLTIPIYLKDSRRL